MDETFDFVVVGSGGGSMCAALLMRQAGKSVAVLEKTELFGGTTAMSGGVMWIPNNRYMKSEGIEDSAERALAYMREVIGDHDDAPGASEARRHMYVTKASAMVDFLVTQGIELRRMPSWPDYYASVNGSEAGRTVVSKLFDLNRLGPWKAKLRPGFLPLPANLDEAMLLPDVKRSKQSKKTLLRVLGRLLLGKLTGKHWATAGQALQAQMLHAAVKAGVEIRMQAPVTQLIVENGRVTGVVLAADGSERRIGARLGVLLNAGGFARNARMVEQYIPGTSSEWSNASPGDTGEMIEEGLRIGAAVAQMDQRVGSPITLPPGNSAIKPAMQGDIAKPHAIVVDQGGTRYLRESSSYVDLCSAMLERNKVTPAIPSWMVFDSQYIEKYMLAGTMPGAKKPKAWTDSQFLRRGDTIEQLAATCGIKTGALQATVERYNGLVTAGRDLDFGRGDHAYDRWLGDALHASSPTLGRIEQGPFYALPIYPGDVSTFGGLVTDEHARVLRGDSSPIDGLYATGTSTASVMGNHSPGAGASIGPSFTWGYVAARHVLAGSADKAPLRVGV